MTRGVLGGLGRLFGITEPEPTLEEVERGEKLSRRDRRHLDLVQFIQEKEIPTDLSVLDVGCGPGYLSERLHAVGFADIAGCDWLAPDELAESARAVIDYRQVDLNEDALAAYPDGAFGLVVCSDVLEHLENPARMFREFERVLAPGGHVFFSIPNAFNLFERYCILRSGNSGRYRSERRAPAFGHISMLPYEVLESLCDRAGLEILDRGRGYVWWSRYFLFPNRSASHLFSYVAAYHLRRQRDLSEAA